ncbi:MAG: hypothetical protein NZM04_10855 [Methylacidiphilales bacterium]|nr:hypothetical protein [Candidatus Methylacidiphilales bacterium]
MNDRGITLDIYRQIESLFNLYTKETLLLMIYFCLKEEASKMIAAVKFLIDKKMIAYIELDEVERILHSDVYRFVHLYLLYMSGDVQAIEEMKRLLHKSYKLIESGYLKIMIEGSDEKNCRYGKKFMRESIENNQPVYLVCRHFNDIFYDTFRDKAIEMMLDKEISHHIIYTLSFSKNPACVKDLISIYKKHSDIKTREEIIKYIGNCLSYEAVDLLIGIIYSN